MTKEEIRAAAVEIAATLPPLTDAQVHKVAQLLSITIDKAEGTSKGGDRR
ncbi:MAG: hypothetical protein V9G19_05785 [Tetrasphaera sp.]